jgi:hypothetical protein
MNVNLFHPFQQWKLFKRKLFILNKPTWVQGNWKCQSTFYDAITSNCRRIPYVYNQFYAKGKQYQLDSFLAFRVPAHSLGSENWMPACITSSNKVIHYASWQKAGEQSISLITYVCAIMHIHMMMNRGACDCSEWTHLMFLLVFE